MHTHTCKPCQSRTMIFDSLNEDVHVRCTTGNVGHFVCKIADTQLVYDFSALNRGPNPVYVIFSFFFNIPLYARVGNLQPFAHIHKSWTVLVCNVVLSLNVEFQSMSSVDSAYKLTHTHPATLVDSFKVSFDVSMFNFWGRSVQVYMLYPLYIRGVLVLFFSSS